MASSSLATRAYAANRRLRTAARRVSESRMQLDRAVDTYNKIISDRGRSTAACTAAADDCIRSSDDWVFAWNRMVELSEISAKANEAAEEWRRNRREQRKGNRA